LIRTRNYEVGMHLKINRTFRLVSQRMYCLSLRKSKTNSSTPKK